MSSSRATFAAVLLLALFSATLAWGRDEVISSDRSATNLSAFSGTLVWSREASDGTHRLVTLSRQPSVLIPPRPEDLSVRPSDSPFDPDLGVDSRGRPIVVYTRCAGLSGRNCDVYSAAGRRERKVEGASSGRCSEFAPSVWKGIVAFARRGPGRCNGLYLKGRGPALRLDRRVPADTDVRGNSIAYLYVPSPSRTVIRLFALSRSGGRSHVVVSGLRAQGERTRVTNPTFAGGYLFFLFEDLRRHEFLVGRRRPAQGSVLQFSDRKLSGSIDSVALDGRTAYYTNGRGVFQADPALRFTAQR